MALAHVHFFSNCLGRGTTCEVILPQNRANTQNSSKPIPVLWLLHGLSDDESAWIRNTSIERYVAPLGLAVVMPFVERSYYTNLAHGQNFYDFVAKELPCIMNSFFGFSMNRENNFICGLSMGGAGALKIGLANPEQYSVIGCLSAGIHNHPLPQDTTTLPRTSREYIQYDQRNLKNTEEDVFSSARRIITQNLPVPRVYHAIGKNDHLLSPAHDTKDFFTSLEGNPFDYVYEEDTGSHSWEYWDKHIQHFLAFLTK